MGLVALEKRDDVRKVLERSGYFSRVHPGAGTEPYHLKFVFSDATGATQRSFQSVNAVFFILSFTMIPMFESGIDALVVDVQSRNRTLRQYHYRESQGGICWTPVGFLALGIYAIATLNDPPPSIEKILLNFLHDVQRDGLMTGQPPG
ncbi:MAG: hypothetical protein HY292_27905 [Planctomycetes bacterium]|nr:hypothetical protein [Planctomycetota bacterium]